MTSHPRGMVMSVVVLVLLIGVAVVAWATYNYGPSEEATTTKTANLDWVLYDSTTRAVSFNYTTEGGISIQEYHRVCRGPGVTDMVYGFQNCDTVVLRSSTEPLANWKTVCRGSSCEDWVEVLIP